MEAIKILAAGAVGYLIGSVSWAVVMSWLVSRKDVRNYGSGNAGATNMARLFGMGVGVATFLLDGLKTVASMALGRLIGGYYGLLTAGIAAVYANLFIKDRMEFGSSYKRPGRWY